MTRVGTVAALYRYPVKSTAGETLDVAEVDGRGLAHDRAWALYTEDGRLGSGKTSRRFRKMDGLLGWRSAMSEWPEDDRPWLRAPDGARHRAGDAATDAALATAFGQPVALRAEIDGLQRRARRREEEAAINARDLLGARAELDDLKCALEQTAAVRDHALAERARLEEALTAFHADTAGTKTPPAVDPTP